MKFLDNLCSEDDEIVDKVMYNEYWYLTRISCLYPKLNTPKWRALSIVHFILYVSCSLYHVILFAITAMKLKNDKTELFQSINHLSVMFITFYMVVLFNKNRYIYAGIHRSMGTGLSNYDEETELLRKSLYSIIQKKKKILLQILLSYFSSIPFTKLFLEKYLNSYSGDDTETSLNPHLPVTIWTPYDTNNLIGYSITVVLMLIGSVALVTVVTTVDISYFLMCEYLAMEVRLLIHSLNRLPERTLHLYRLRHGDNTNVSMETIKKNKDLLNCYRDCLKQNIIHHQNIIKNMYAPKTNQQLRLLSLDEHGVSK
ncbi:hypothetical protein O3M35_009070 [Rhynocoris fuscipes]|uniref:Odorant receptor n=1 Tax=Rhynocoris fuscipes TaxID=488301 RepID=A0AAW1D4L7_9HEMI